MVNDLKSLFYGYQRKNKNFFAEAFYIDDIESYLTDMEKEGIWASQMEAYAISLIHKRPIKMYFYGTRSCSSASVNRDIFNTTAFRLQFKN